MIPQHEEFEKFELVLAKSWTDYGENAKKVDESFLFDYMSLNGAIVSKCNKNFWANRTYNYTDQPLDKILDF